MAFERAAQIRDFQSYTTAGPVIVQLAFELLDHMPASCTTREQKAAFVANGLTTLDIEHRWNHVRLTQSQEEQMLSAATQLVMIGVE